MQKILGDFIHSLRQAGLPISSAETLDALQAAQLVGIDDAALLKHSLGMTLSKNLPNRQLFDQTFDQFFGHQELQIKQSTKSSDNDTTAAINPDLAPPALAADDSAVLQTALAQQLMGNNIGALQVMIASAAAGAGAQTMTAVTQIPLVTFRVMQSLGDNQLQQQLSALTETATDNAQIQLLRQRRTLLQQQVRGFVEQQFLLYSSHQPQAMRARNIQRINLTNIDQRNYKLMASLVRKAAKRLASMHSRRRRITKRGLLDVRRTIAANAAYDGFLFHTKWKTTRVERPKVMVICDVSGSVSRVAKFLLLFLYSLQDVLPKVRSFVFSADMAEVTSLFDQQSLEESLTQVVDKWGNKPTDYGKALRDFKDLAVSDIDHRTTVIMLGDARNNKLDGNTEIWQAVYRRSQRVLWLNPEREFSWDTGDSIMSEYLPYCSQVETCNTLSDLNRILGSMLKRAS